MAVAIVAALLYREKTGEGQAIDMSMTDNIVNQNRNPIARGVASGKPAPRAGMGFPGLCPADTYRCRGDELTDCVYIAGVQPHHYEILMKVVGREDLIDGLRDDIEGRYEKREIIREEASGGSIQVLKMHRQRILIMASPYI